MISIALLDDHQLFVQTLGDYLSSQLDNIQVNGFNMSRDFIGSLNNQHYDLLIIDLEMPERSGIEVIHEVQKLHPKQRIMVLSMFYNIQIAYELDQLGVMAFLPKNAEVKELKNGIRHVLDDQKYFRKEFGKDALQEHGKKKIHLSRRELQIIQLASEGKTSAQIGEELFITEGTVKTHIQHVLTKTDSKNLKEAIAYYKEMGLKVFV